MDAPDGGLLAGLPQPSEDSKPFWAGCNEGKLLLQRCKSCSHVFYYARRLCPACGESDLVWEESSGYATVYSFSEVHVPFPGPEWASQLPYTILLVDLDEGPRMLSRWHDAAGVPRVGDRVKVTFPEVGGQKLPFFALEVISP